jgi:hypothetical protein
VIGYMPKEFVTPMNEKDHPDIYTSGLLDALGINHYQ